MARYNEILVGRFARAVQKLFGMKGEVPVGSLAGELQVVHPFLNGIENRYLEGWDRFGFQNSQAGAASVFTSWRFRNPLTSNVVAVFEKIQCAVGPTDALVQDQTIVNVGTTNADLSTLSPTQQQLDSRGRTNSTLIISSQTNAGLVGHNIGIVFSGANGGDFILFDDHEFAVLPGQALHFQTQVVNQALVVAAIWRERQLEESERA